LVNVDVTGQALTATEGTLTQSSNQEIDVTGFDLIANGSNPTHDTLTAFGEAPFATLSPATFNIPVGGRGHNRWNCRNVPSSYVIRYGCNYRYC